MGELMARELVDLVAAHNASGRDTRVIVPCGPSAWYAPWTAAVNQRRVSLARLAVFHMDECLDWQGGRSRRSPLQLPHVHGAAFLRRHRPRAGGAGGRAPLAAAFDQDEVRARLAEGPIRPHLGGWGQDGHVAYNQARRHPFLSVTLEELADSTIRVQENTSTRCWRWPQRTFGAAYQFVPPMSITWGLRECLSARQVRVFSDTGAWKQTALRVALFSEPTPSTR
jgi:glucosamine-6-phosphate deaminase